MAVSTIFEVVAEEIAFTPDKMNYFFGENVKVAYRSPNKIPFQSSDSICLFYDNVTTYNRTECSQNIYSYLPSSRALGNVVIRAVQGVGKFKAAMFLDQANEAALFSDFFWVSFAHFHARNVECFKIRSSGDSS